MIASPASQRWQFLAFILYRVKKDQNETAKVALRRTIEDFRLCCESQEAPLFVKEEDQASTGSITTRRCAALLSVLDDKS
jgi:hypothetical protein